MLEFDSWVSKNCTQQKPSEVLVHKTEKNKVLVKPANLFLARQANFKAKSVPWSLHSFSYFGNSFDPKNQWNIALRGDMYQDTIRSGLIQVGECWVCSLLWCDFMWFYLRIYVDYHQLVEVYIERYWKQSAAAWTFVMADTTKVKHVANRMNVSNHIKPTWRYVLEARIILQLQSSPHMWVPLKKCWNPCSPMPGEL